MRNAARPRRLERLNRVNPVAWRAPVRQYSVYRLSVYPDQGVIMQTSGEALKSDLKKLNAAVERTPGVYEVMQLYAQYQRVLEQSRVYLIGRARAVGFSSSDRTG